MSVKFVFIDGNRNPEAIARFLEENEGIGVLILESVLLFAMHYTCKCDAMLLSKIGEFILPWDGTVVLTVSGLCNDEREVFEVPEVQRLVSELSRSFPRLIVMPNLDPESRHWLYLAEAISCGGTVEKVKSLPVQSYYPALTSVPDRIYRVSIPEDARQELFIAKRMLEDLSNKARNRN